MTRKLELDANLKEFATPRQWELLRAWEDIGSSYTAAEKLGVHYRLFSQARTRVLEKAARAGYIPPDTSQFHMRDRVPAGFTLKGQSAYVAKDGSLLARWDKTKEAGMEPDEAHSLPDPKKTVKLSTMYNAEGKVIVQWVAEKPEDIAKEHAWRAFAEELTKDLKRIEPTPAPKFTHDGLLAGYPVGDHHLGMLAWKHETGASYDIDIGERLLVSAFNHLTKTVLPAAQAVVVFLGDFMHYDSMIPQTPTSRNQVDADSRFPKMARAAVRAMRTSIDLVLAAHSKVHVIVESGNHDLASTHFLATCLEIAYEKEPRVTVDISPKHYHYFRFHNVLLGTHHGHGTKMSNLPLIMAADRPEDWGATGYRYWWTGHIHQSKVQPATSALDFSGVTVESFRILAPSDAWGHQKGYRPHRDMKAVLFHKDYGEVARHTVNPAMLEGA